MIKEHWDRYQQLLAIDNPTDLEDAELAMYCTLHDSGEAYFTEKQWDLVKQLRSFQ